MCLLRRWLGGVGDLPLALLVWALLLGVTALVSEVVWLLFQYVDRQGQLDPDGRFGFLFRSLGVAAIVGALMLRYLYLHHQWRRQLLAEAEARLQALQSRIRPHFLFNSMNTIASLIATRPEQAEELVQDLADLFRVCLADAGRSSTLGEELELTRRYLHIEQQRLGERLRVQWDLEDTLPMDARVPALVLQPLLENAVYHGIEPALEPGVVTVTGRYRRGQVNLSMRNSLPSDGAEPRRVGHRLALENVRQRLAGMFRGRATLTESLVEGEYQVRVAFPHPWEGA
jgi:two-component system sensor histidine kinase AlgZ